MKQRTDAEDDLHLWRGLPTSAVSDTMGRVGAMDAGISRLSGDSLVGRAYPVWTAAGDNSTIHLAVNAAPSGAVLVVDAEGHLGRAVWGHVLTVAAQRRGLSGAVIDGAIRDIDEVRARGFPIYARGVCPAGPHKGFLGRHGTRAQCGGVAVALGDLILCDADGVSVVPASEIEAVLPRVREKIATEAEWMRRIEEGASTVDILGIGADHASHG